MLDTTGCVQSITRDYEMLALVPRANVRYPILDLGCLAQHIQGSGINSHGLVLHMNKTACQSDAIDGHL